MRKHVDWQELVAQVGASNSSLGTNGYLSLVALTSNLAFIASGLTPVLVLHSLLLPVNACRLV